MVRRSWLYGTWRSHNAMEPDIFSSFFLCFIIFLGIEIKPREDAAWVQKLHCATEQSYILRLK